MDAEVKKYKKRPTKIEEMSKEQIRLAILKKRECNSLAQKIVESLLEKCISEVYLLECLPDINQNHFDDVIEERSIIHLCGYPLCQKTLKETEIPKQKYRISVKTNKVYDITGRKHFCSNMCYNAAMYVRKQMLTSPLWFREYEEIPKFHIMPLDTTGSLGQEIDVSIIEKIDVKPVAASFASINDFARASLSEIGDTQTDDNHDKKISLQIKNQETEDKLNKIEFDNNYQSAMEKQKTITKNEPPLINKDDNASKTKLKSKHQAATTEKLDKIVNDKKAKKPNPLNIVGDIIEKPTKNIDPILTDIPQNIPDSTKTPKKLPQKKQHSVAVIAIEVEKCLAEWFTLDTMLFLLGEEKVKEMVTDKGECIKEYLNNYANSIFYSSNSYDQYQTLCRKLNMLELEDRRNDSQMLQRETKPLPDYLIIQEESKNLQLKVRAFLSGDTDIPLVSSNTNNSNDEDDITKLPLVDKNAQNALRRRIVCEHLNKVLPDLLRSLGLLTLAISSDVRLLVNTFKLKANNIMFKPIQWTLIAIIVIKLLSLRDRRLEYLLVQPTAYQHMQLLLLSYKQDGGYLDRLISWLTDIDRLLDTNDTQLTIE